MNIQVSGRSQPLVAKVGTIAIGLGLVVASFATLAAPFSAFAADGQLSVLINGAPPTGFCVAGPITVSGTGRTGQQGGTWHLAIGWGDGATTTPTVTSGTLSGQNEAFSYSQTRTLTATSTGITVVLYHSQPSGQDGQVIVVNQCVAAPTQGVVVLAKHVVNDNQFNPGTAVASNFTLHISTFNFTGSETGATPGAILSAGTYSVTETGPSGYAQTSLVCIGDDNTTTTNGSVTVVAGKNYVCTVTNNDNQPTTGVLRVIKHVVTDNGGTATAADFSLHAMSGASEVSGSPQIGSETGTDYTLTGGPYNVSETGAPAGYTAFYSGACDSNGDVIVVNGLTATCTITNDDIAPSLTLEKIVINVFRGISIAADWVLTAIGPDTIFGTSPVSSGSTFPSGTYTLTEGGPSNEYNASVWVCTGGSQSGDTITLGLGESATCTITNTDKEPGTLHVIKHVINDEPVGFAGTAQAGDFTLQVSGGNPSPASFEGSEAGTDVVIDAGASFSVSETGPTSGYAMSQSADCSGIMPEGGSLTCTVTNNDNPATTGGLTVIKVLPNDNGGSAVAGDWTYHVADDSQNSTTVSSGASNQFAGGTYTVSETDGPAGYEATFSGDCDEDGSVTVVNGESKTCTITNDDIAPTITLIKDVVKDNGGTAEENAFGLSIGGTPVASGETFPVDAHVPVEIMELGLTGYSFVSITGDEECPSILGGTITLSEGDNITCTITNDDIAGELTVIKDVINDNGGIAEASDFTIHVEGTDVSDASFPGDEVGTTVTLDAGDYSVSESGPEGYGADMSAECAGSIGLAEHKTCTITNDDGKATLTIVKHTTNADGTFTFDVSDGDAVTSASITTENHSGTTTLAIDAGHYSLTENVPFAWVLLSGDFSRCEYENQSVGTSIPDGESITLDPGDLITCTFTNTSTNADISVSKSVDDTTPDAGQQITYTLTASNSGPADALNVIVTDTLPTSLTYVSDDASSTNSTYATSTGQWVIGTLQSGATTTLHLIASVNSGMAGQAIVNTATATSTNADSNIDNNSSTVSVSVNTPTTPTPTVTPPSSGGGGGGGDGGGGNGPIVGSFGGGGSVVGASTGQVLGAASTTLPELPPGCIALLNTYMRQGKKNNQLAEVKKLQQFLNDERQAHLPLTGFFGPLTDKAVRGFQIAHTEQVLKPWGLNTSTGFVYKTTQRWINLINCSSLNIPLPTNLTPYHGEDL
ncbi:MAG TPA: hypothetical protein VJG64_04830 [Candidatus Paceibacterota bacterium]